MINFIPDSETNTDTWTIAIIDDVADFHQMVKLSLQNETFLGQEIEFVHAHSFAEAQNVLHQSPPDIILLDVVMETEHAGFDCVKYIRSEPDLAHIPIIIVSGQAGAFSEKEAIKEYDINSFIKKTEVTVERLYAEINAALKYAKQLDEAHELNEELVAMHGKLHDLRGLNEAAESIAAVGGWEWDVERQKLIWTTGVYDIYGLPQDTPLSVEKAISHYPDESRQRIAEVFNRAIYEGENYDISLPIRNANGEKRWVRTNGRVRKSQGQVTHVYGAISDITEHQNSLVNAQESNQFIRNILDNLSDAVIVVNRNGKIIETNKAVENIFGLKKETIVAQGIEVLMPEPFASRHKHYMREYFRTGEAHIIGRSRELPAIHAEGHIFPMELTLSEFHVNEKHLFIGIVRDISERKKAQQKMIHLAYYDQVTNLPNLQHFNQYSPERLEKSVVADRSIAMLLVDIDGFYRVNQAYGHDIGDNVLSLIAERINYCLPESAELYRANGPDFLIYQDIELGDCSADVEKLAKRVIKRVANELDIDGNIHHLTVSIGSFVDKAKSWDKDISTTLSRLELAVKEAKSQGGSCNVLFDEKLNAEFIRRYNIEYELKRALQREEFELHFQPKVDRNRQSYSAEVLLRWNSPKLGFVSPAEFIPLAEQSGLIKEIGSYVLVKAFENIKQLRSSGKHATVAINISAAQIIQRDFYDFVTRQLELYEIIPGEVTFELTETALALDIQTVINNMKRLNDVGIEFSIDDFGTGYSSLSYLQQLPINELKIDKSFIDNLLENETSRKLVETISTMANSMQLKVVAEGVETEAQYELLQEQHCDYYQGYLFAKPMSFDDWRNWLF